MASEAAPRRARRRFLLLPALLLALPPFLDQYQQYVVNLVLVYIPVGVGFNLVVGNLGQLAFSNVAFFGIGAYTSGILMLKLGLPWWATLPPAGIMGALAGGAASVPALRGVRSFYLAVMTLAFGELMRWSYIRLESLTGGSMGMAVPSADVFGWALATEWRKFYVFLALAAATVIATDRLLRSRIGRAFMAIKDNETAAAAMGIATSGCFVLGFARSGLLVGHLSPDSFDLIELILQFAIIMVGGLASLTGSVLGAVVITATPQIFANFPGFQELIFGLLIVLVILFLPRGLASLLARLHPVFRDQYYDG